MFVDPSGQSLILGAFATKAVISAAGALAAATVALGGLIFSGKAEQVGTDVIDGVSDLWNKIKDLFASKEEDKVVDLAPDVAKTEENSPSKPKEIPTYQEAWLDKDNNTIRTGRILTLNEAKNRVYAHMDVMCSDARAAYALVVGGHNLIYEIDSNPTSYIAYYHFHINGSHGSPHIWHYGPPSSNYITMYGKK